MICVMAARSHNPGALNSAILSDERKHQQIYNIMMTDLLHHVTWRCDIETMTVLEVSSSIESVSGYMTNDIIGRPICDVLTPSSYDKLRDSIPTWLKTLASSPNKELRFVKIVEQLQRKGIPIRTKIAGCLFYRADGKVEAIGISQALKHEKELLSMYNQIDERERFLQSVLDSAPCCLSCLDTYGNFLYVNQRYANELNLDQKKIRGHHFSEALPLEIYAKHEQIFAECLQGENVDFLDYCKVGGSGKDYWAYGIYKPIFFDNGQIEKIIVVIMDISEQHEVKRQLMEAEKLGQTGSWKMNLLTKKFTCSEGVLTLFNLSPQNIEEHSYNALFSHSDPEEVKRIKKKFYAFLLIDQISDQCVSEEIVVNIPNKPKRLMRITASLLKNADGDLREIVGRVDDITQQRVLEKADRDAILRLREFSRTIPGAGMIVDETGIIIDVFDDNQLLGETSETTWPGQSLSCVLPAVESQRLIENINQALNKKMLQFHECILNLTESMRQFEVRIAPLSYYRENRTTVACFWTDVTDQSRTKKMLELIYEKRCQRDLLNDLLLEKLTPSQEVLDQARHVNIDLSPDFSFYLIGLIAPKKDETALDKKIQRNLQKIVDGVLCAFTDYKGVIAWECAEGIALLSPIDPSTHQNQAEELQQAEQWQKIMRKYAPLLKYRMGIAEYHANTFWFLAKLYKQACTAVALGGKINPGRIVHHYLDIGVFQFFPDMNDDEYVNDFMKRTLGKLEKYDQTFGTVLMDTLIKILQTDNLSEVAKQLYVHRQTVLYRKRRIEEVLNVSLEDFETKLSLGMALKLKQAFGDN